MDRRPDRPKPRHTVRAPEPTLPATGAVPANRVVSVDVEDGEEVEWTWTSLPDGSRYVSGYTITRKG